MKPSKMEERLAETNRFRDEVNAHIAAKRDGAAPEPAQPAKPTLRRLSPAACPTEIPGYPLNDSPPKDVPQYGTMARVVAMRETRAAQARLRGKRAPMSPSGPPELRKRSGS
jgi:hypothetical protein